MPRALSPCPCGSAECVEEYKRDLKTVGNVIAPGPLDRFRGRGKK